MLVTVVLDKGPKGVKRFNPEPEARAYQRADALADLHATGHTTSRDGLTIYVWAQGWYERREVSHGR